MSEKLKPCPFCGGEAQRFSLGIGTAERVRIDCRGCHLKLSEWFSPEDVAVAAWNRRAPDPIRERLAEAIRAFGSPVEPALMVNSLNAALDELDAALAAHDADRAKGGGA